MKTDLFPTEDVDEVVGKNERGRIAVDQATRGPLDVAQEVPEIDVEQVSVLLDHDVIVVPVRDAEHVRRHAAPGARAQEVVGRLAVPAIIRERSINRRHVYTKQTGICTYRAEERLYIAILRLNCRVVESQRPDLSVVAHRGRRAPVEVRARPGRQHLGRHHCQPRRPELFCVRHLKPRIAWRAGILR